MNYILIEGEYFHMVTRRFHSFDRLISELSNLGRFTKSVPTDEAPKTVRDILDYLYDELNNLMSKGFYPLDGLLQEISFDWGWIHVRTFYRFKSIHIKSFPISKENEELLKMLLAQIPSYYSSLKIVPKDSFVEANSSKLSYNVEYNDIPEDGHQK